MVVQDNTMIFYTSIKNKLISNNMFTSDSGIVLIFVVNLTADGISQIIFSF